MATFVDCNLAFLSRLSRIQLFFICAPFLLIKRKKENIQAFPFRFYIFLLQNTWEVFPFILQLEDNFTH